MVLAELQPKPRLAPRSDGSGLHFNFEFEFELWEDTQYVAVKKLRLAADDSGSLAVSVLDFALTRHPHWVLAILILEDFAFSYSPTRWIY